MENKEQSYTLVEAFGRLYKIPNHMVKMFNSKKEAVEDWGLDDRYFEFVHRFQDQYTYFECT